MSTLASNAHSSIPSEQPFKMYTPVYQTIYEYENLIYPLASTALGYTNYGIYGAAIGLVLGTTDLVAINYNFYDKPHLTIAVLGASALRSLKLPYYIGEAIGATGSLAILNEDITSAYLEPLKNTIKPYIAPIVIDASYESMVAPIQGAIYGYNYGKHYGMGGSGALIGGVLGAIDEGLSLYNITNNYYCTSALNAMAITNLMLQPIPRVTNYLLPDSLGVFKSIPYSLTQAINKPMIKEAIVGGIASLSVYSNYNQSTPKEQWTAFKVKDDLHELYGDLIPKKQLDDLIYKQATTLIASQLIIAQLSLDFSGYNQEFDKYFANLGIDQESWLNFLITYKNLAVFVTPYVAGYISSACSNSYFSRALKYKLKDSINDKYLHSDTALYLTQNNPLIDIDSNVLVQKKNDDIDVIIGKGNELLTEGLSAIIKGGYNLMYLCSNNAEDMIMYSAFYNQITSSISSYLAVKASASDVEIEDIKTKLKSTQEYVKEHSLEMAQANANNFIKLQEEELESQLRSLQETSEIWGIVDYCWRIGKSISDTLYNHLIVANKINQGEFVSNQGAAIISASSSVSDLFGWEAENSGKIIEFEQSKLRLMELNKRMEEVNLEPEHKVQYSFKQANQTSICFKDLKIGVGDESRFSLDDLCIEGQRTAIVAKSGGGKSTFLAIVKGITHGQAWGEGEITYYTPNGNEPKIVMTQRQYLPPYNSLLELITFKRGDEAKALELTVIELLEEIKINSDEDKGAAKNLVSRLNDKADWKVVLSDGQIQKIAAIRVILEKPDIAILDELLKGLDSSSTIIVEEMLVKHLPQTLFLVVDHHVKTNNHNNFYDSVLYFANKTATINNVDYIEEYYNEEPINIDMSGEFPLEQMPATI